MERVNTAAGPIYISPHPTTYGTSPTMTTIYTTGSMLHEAYVGFVYKMAMQHKPDRQPDIEPGQYVIRCKACDANNWKIWQIGDPPVVCEIWKEAMLYGIVDSHYDEAMS